MDLYFAPLACSMATRIALYEAGERSAVHRARPQTSASPTASDFSAINPLGMVPALRTDEGELITENAAILQYVAERCAASRPRRPRAASRARGCISGSASSAPNCTRRCSAAAAQEAPAEVKAYAASLADARFAIVEKHLGGREFLLDAFSIADAYPVHGAQLDRRHRSTYPAIQAYMARLAKRPSIAKALGEELEMYKAEVAKQKAA